MEKRANLKNPINIFKDPFNPAEEELKIWAYGEYYSPVEDFELYVTTNPLFTLSLAADALCPNNAFFLKSLYVWVGDKVKNNEYSGESLSKLLEEAEKYDNKEIQEFIARSKDLISKPETYDYSKWGL